MKVSDITVNDIVDYCRIEEPSEDDMKFIGQAMAAAKAYMRSYTGLNDDGIDSHEDFLIVFYVLIQDMYDNRSLYTEGKALNNTVDTILGMHSVNLL